MSLASSLRAATAETTLGRILRSPLSLLPRDVQVPVLAGPLRGARWVRSSGPDGYWLGLYEPRDTTAFCSLLRLGQTVWDVGAHVGYYTLLAARSGAARVVSVEPLPRNRELLQHHVDVNGYGHAVRVADVAVCGSVGEARLKLPLRTSETRLAGFGEDGETAGDCICVRATTLDDLLAERLAQGERPPSLVKMDIEGAEGMALVAAERLLSDVGPAIVLSLHGPGDADELALTTCERHGYRFTFLSASEGAHRKRPWGTAVGITS